MDRFDLIRSLQLHIADDGEEENMRRETIAFVEKHENCFDRELLIGHVTASAWIVNPERTHVLLMHHRKLDRWFQPGGHCDGDPDVQAAAIKETYEETGLAVKTDTRQIFDVDVHIIPERKAVPEHKHYDIRFLFSAEMEEEELGKNDEANAVRWIPLDRVYEYNSGESIMRMLRKVMMADR